MEKRNGECATEKEARLRLSMNSLEKFNAKQDVSETAPLWCSQRLSIAALIFLGLVVTLMQRSNVSIAMVCMVRTHDPRENNSSSTIWAYRNSTADSFPSSKSGIVAALSDSTGPQPNITGVSNTTLTMMTTTTVDEDDDYCGALGRVQARNENGEFFWDKKLQGLVLASFFWGYLVVQIPGGMASQSLGPKVVVSVVTVLGSLLTLAVPACARVSPWLLMANRVLVGACQSAMYPAIFTLMSRWVPPAETGRLLTVVYAGAEIGNVVVFSSGGYLCRHLGWDSVFYTTGSVSLVWCLGWHLLGSDGPSSSRRISNAEKTFLSAHIKINNQDEKRPPVPWVSMFKSTPFWAILIVHPLTAYGYYMMLTQIPTYMKEVLKFDLTFNGLFSMLPYAVLCVSITGSGMLADLLLHKKILSRVRLRKLMTLIGTICPATCLVLITFIDCTQQALGVLLLCGAIGLAGPQSAGIFVNHIDIAPQFAGVMFAITNAAATGSGVLAPYLVGIITANKTKEEWQVAFLIGSAINGIAGLTFLCLAQATIQKWAQRPDIEIDVPEESESELESEKENMILADLLNKKDPTDGLNV